MIGSTVLDATKSQGALQQAPPVLPTGDAAFTAMLDERVSAAELARHEARSSGRSRAQEPQNRRKELSDPSLRHDLTALSVSELSSRGPLKATLAQAREEQTQPAEQPDQCRDADSPRVQRGINQSRDAVTDTPNRAATAIPSSEPSGAKSVGTPHVQAPTSPTDQPASGAVVAASSPQGSATSHPVIPAYAAAQPASIGAVQATDSATPAAPDRSSSQGNLTSNSIAAIKTANAADKLLKAASPTQSTPRFKLETNDKFAAQAARGLAAAIRQGQGSVTLRLQPEALGDLKVRMDLAHGRVEASFEVETDQARHLLGNSLSDLRTALEARGLEVDRLDVRVADRAGHPQQNDDPGNPFGGADGQTGGGAGDEQGSPWQDARGDGPTGRTPLPGGMERTPPDPLADTGPAHGARPAQPLLFIEPGGDPLMRVRLDAVA